MNVTFLAKLRKGTLSAAVMASIVVGSGFIAAPTSAYAIYYSSCSTFYQQMLEYAEAVNTALNTAEQLQTQVKQYQNMVTQGIDLPNSMWGSVAIDMRGIVNIYQRSQTLGHNLQNLDQQFNTQIPGWQQYLDEVANLDQHPTSQTMPNRCRAWSQQGRDNVKSIMEAANMNASTFESEGAQLDRMMARSQSAADRIQAIQAGNEIASQDVQQLQKLRDLVTTQINLQGNYMTQEQNHRDLDDALRAQRCGGTITRTGNNKGYQMLNIKVITLVLLLVGSAVIGGADTIVYINSASATTNTTAALNCEPKQHPAETFKHVDPVNTRRGKGY